MLLHDSERCAHVLRAGALKPCQKLLWHMLHALVMCFLAWVCAVCMECCMRVVFQDVVVNVAQAQCVSKWRCERGLGAILMWGAACFSDTRAPSDALTLGLAMRVLARR